MKKNLLLAAMSLVALAVPTFAAPASAHSAVLDPEPIAVTITSVTLGGNPDRPTATSTVTVKNVSTRTERAVFDLSLVSSVALGPSTDCAPGGKWDYVCGGWDLAPGASVSVALPLAAAMPEAAFGISLRGGTVQGRTADGRTGLPQDFEVTWPKKTELKLGVVRDPLDPESVRVSVRNAGTFEVEAYSLIVMTPAGVDVTSTACAASDDGEWCDVRRTTPLAAGATDDFQLHLAIAGAKDVEFFLAPVARYTNSDTTALVRLGS